MLYFWDFTTWQTTSFLVFSFVRKRGCPGSTETERRITAPLASTNTVLVASENGSRFSLPSTARVPLTVTRNSSPTGCELLVSPLADEIHLELSGFSGEVGGAEPSLSIAGMSYSPAREPCGGSVRAHSSVRILSLQTR